MGEKPQHSSLEKFPGPSSYSVVAPFAADIDTSSTGSVRYSDTFKSQLNDVSEHIRAETGSLFYGTWMLVAEWNGVPLPHTLVLLYPQSSVSACIFIYTSH